MYLLQKGETIYSHKKTPNLVDEVLELYQIDEGQLAEMINTPKSTINSWKNARGGRISNSCIVIMKLLIENYELKRKDALFKELFSLYK